MSANQPLQLPTRERNDERPAGGQAAARGLRGRHRAQRHARARQAPRQARQDGARARWRCASTSIGVGFPGLLSGSVSKEPVPPPAARLLVEGLSDPSGCAASTGSCPEERFEAAVAAFEAGFDEDPEAACRRLFYDLLWPCGRSGPAPMAGRAELRHGRPGRDPRRSSSPRRGSSTSCETAATPRPRGSARRTGSSIRGPGARASTGGSSASERSTRAPRASRATGC